ncbi:MAG: ACP S-malonyltransferase [Alphaproteobacteria bacterium]|nr:ACP S-malonyltransferase [Alphaproteobacteria bacterium]MDD9919505.1 ACP S-malonyltransferase [Alphaproteobacteria bacterium]
MNNPAETAFVFPGQGSQHPGMASEFMTTPSVGPLFEAADDILGYKLSEIMQKGTEEDLRKTENAQPALLLASVAVWSYLQKQTGKALNEMASIAAGHSVGEYVAACITGVLSFEDALKLVHARGKAMAEAVPAGEGSMAAVLGGTWNDVFSTCQTTGCFVANDNATGQLVISGPTGAIDEASNMLAMQEVKKIMRLEVSGPFHTQAMEPAADTVASELEALKLSKPLIPLVMNVTAEKTTNTTEIKENLIAQITQMVRWRESMRNLGESGITQVVELGSGKVLTGLLKRCDSRLQGTTLNTPQDIDNWMEALEAAA